jgi:hypothetical protein
MTKRRSLMHGWRADRNQVVEVSTGNIESKLLRRNSDRYMIDVNTVVRTLEKPLNISNIHIAYRISCYRIELAPLKISMYSLRWLRRWNLTVDFGTLEGKDADSFTPC